GNLTQVALAARQCVAPTGICVVTLGSRGALLVDNERKEAIYQPVPAVVCIEPVGAGDALCAAMLSRKVYGANSYTAFVTGVLAAVDYVRKQNNIEVHTADRRLAELPDCAHVPYE